MAKSGTAEGVHGTRGICSLSGKNSLDLGRVSEKTHLSYRNNEL